MAIKRWGPRRTRDSDLWISCQRAHGPLFSLFGCGDPRQVLVILAFCALSALSVIEMGQFLFGWL